MKFFLFLIGSFVLPIVFYLVVAYGKLDFFWLNWDYIQSLTEEIRLIQLIGVLVLWAFSAVFSAAVLEAFYD